MVFVATHTASAQTLLGKLRQPIAHARGVRVTRGMHALALAFVCKTAVPRVCALTNRVKASLTSVGNGAGSPEPLLRSSPASGHHANILDVYDPTGCGL
jgi:hypothetical protein